MSWAEPSKICSSFYLFFFSLPPPTLISQNTETKIILSDKCHILIATPGRLLDHLQTIPLAQRLTNLQTVVFDEADRLLDQGFKKDLDAIMEFLPRKETGRQSLLFSATISEEIKQVRRVCVWGGGESLGDRMSNLFLS